MVKEQFIRNLGIMSEEEVQKLHNTAIAVAGCGCIGGFSAELLARMGIGKLILADPDTFDVSNINRQCAATHLTVGQRKAEALKNHLLTINPNMEIVCYNDGVTETNVASFLDGADYVIDAIDYFAFPESVALHRAARQKDLFITTAVALGFGTSVLTFDPKGLTLEDYTNIPEDITIEELQGKTFPPSAYSQNLPDYATEENIAGWVENRSIPTISVGQALGPGVLVSKLVLHLLDRQMPKIVPDYFQLQFE
ncbi:ThiF family protein [Alkalibacterium subtropicum]|uniref:ThiF family protein n=1 Tax=Alkalibacterium subtropicum TaxID=753702 RepID=A0A1I1HKC0_9LACT|nr:ThiF family adenylyltransferase [Alkalibacterium subtropicum]SFC24012.1 ThiF family protein [Alkalibacterium subtropicum]